MKLRQQSYSRLTPAVASVARRRSRDAAGVRVASAQYLPLRHRVSADGGGNKPIGRGAVAELAKHIIACEGGKRHKGHTNRSSGSRATQDLPQQ